MEVARPGLYFGSSGMPAVLFGTSCCSLRAEGACGCQDAPGGSRSHRHWQVIYLCAFKLKTTCQTKLLC